jgi:hypothetical protein
MSQQYFDESYFRSFAAFWGHNSDYLMLDTVVQTTMRIGHSYVPFK